MAVYALANRTSSGTTAAAALEVRTTSTKTAKLLVAELFLAAATASTYGIGRAAAIGVTPTSPQTVLAEDVGTGTVTTALAWATPPTVPANFFKRIAFPATIGVGVIWTFPRGITIPVSNSLVYWNLATNGVIDANIEVEE
jgi:hypothetical protein